MACNSIVGIIIMFVFLSTAIGVSDHDGLIKCLRLNSIRNFTSFQSDQSSTYYDLLNFSIQNLRFTEPTVPKPYVLIVPQSKPEVQKSVICCRQSAWEIRVRSGGHSYEGLSSTADVPFVIIDLINLNTINVDLQSQTAWVEGGATLGETYYEISQKTGDYGFTAGSCPTVGSGGHISGGGFGLLSRKYGLAADNVVDAQLIDSAGNLLDRKSMGEDVFWALRGGGGGSWGVVAAWKIQLVRVPPVITVFMVSRRGLNHVTDLVYKWQLVAPNLEDNFYMSVFVGSNLPEAENLGISATFKGMHLGPRTETLESVNTAFPELGISAEDCKEMSWIESVVYFSGLRSGSVVNDLRDRYLSDKNYFYAKSDYVRNPVPKAGIRGACRILEQEPKGYVIFDPYGGKMAEIASNALPFPHRAGNLFDIQYLVAWTEGGNGAGYLAWLRRFYEYMTPYVSHNPRAAYVNYVDLDLGTVTSNGTRTLEMAERWGEKYFLGNFERLVRVKSRFDPENVFRNPQSIPVVQPVVRSDHLLLFAS